MSQQIVNQKKSLFEELQAEVQAVFKTVRKDVQNAVEAIRKEYERTSRFQLTKLLRREKENKENGEKEQGKADFSKAQRWDLKKDQKKIKNIKNIKAENTQTNAANYVVTGAFIGQSWTNKQYWTLSQPKKTADAEARIPLGTPAQDVDQVVQSSLLSAGVSGKNMGRLSGLLMNLEHKAMQGDLPKARPIASSLSIRSRSMPSWSRERTQGHTQMHSR